MYLLTPQAHLNSYGFHDSSSLEPKPSPASCKELGYLNAGLFQGKGDMEVTWCKVNIPLNLDLPSPGRNTLLRKYFVSL